MVKLKTLSKKTAFVLAVASAAVVGGASTVLVNAAIPDTSGTIHGCYRTGGLLQSGALRVIDTGTSQTCNNNETGLNWSQSGGSGGGAPVVHDANGQTLGTLLRSTSNGAEVYNATLHRDISMYQNYDTYVDVGEPISPYYPTADCSGTPYLENATIGAKLTLFTWRVSGTHPVAMVADNAQVSTIAVQSRLTVDEYNPNGACQTDSGTRDAYPLTTVTLPFSAPLAMPFKF
jgi:hypothetical protein